MPVVVVSVDIPNRREGRGDRANARQRAASPRARTSCRPVRSIYRWQGEICDDSETLAIIKTTRERFDAMRARLVALHPYEVPR